MMAGRQTRREVEHAVVHAPTLPSDMPAPIAKDGARNADWAYRKTGWTRILNVRGEGAYSGKPDETDNFIVVVKRITQSLRNPRGAPSPPIAVLPEFAASD